LKKRLPKLGRGYLSGLKTCIVKKYLKLTYRLNERDLQPLRVGFRGHFYKFDYTWARNYNSHFSDIKKSKYANKLETRHVLYIQLWFAKHLLLISVLSVF